MFFQIWIDEHHPTGDHTNRRIKQKGNQGKQSNPIV
jgi:hypothetical protein